MSELANYSIETDQVVLLSFKDGRSLRVPLKHLSRYIKGADLDKIKKAINLRRHFLRIHMPRLFIVLAAVGGLVALLSLGGKTVAGLFSRPHTPQTVPSRSGIARSQLDPTPELSPGAQQPVPGGTRLSRVTAPAKSKVRISAHATVTAVKPATPAVQLTSQSVVTPLDSSSTIKPAAPVQTADPTQQAPAVTPTPAPNPTPAPSASPTPSPVPQGQVLGDSTSPVN